MDFEIAKEKATKYIGISKKTSYEVKNKLKTIGCDNDICSRVIEYLTDLNYINDNEYVDAYIRQNMRLLKYSIYEIKQKLLQKGIDKDIIEVSLQKLRDLNYEKSIIDKISSKYSDEKKLKQYLYRRGFSNKEESYD